MPLEQPARLGKPLHLEFLSLLVPKAELARFDPECICKEGVVGTWTLHGKFENNYYHKILAPIDRLYATGVRNIRYRINDWIYHLLAQQKE